MQHYQKSYPADRENFLVSGRQTRYLKLSSPVLFNRRRILVSHDNNFKKNSLRVNSQL